jgi:hypothetical protein
MFLLYVNHSAHSVQLLMLCVLNQQVLNSMYEFPEDGTDVQKYVRAVKSRTFKCVCNMCSKLVVLVKINRFILFWTHIVFSVR